MGQNPLFLACFLHIIILNFYLPEFEQAEILLVVPRHEGVMLLRFQPRPLLGQGARLLLVLLSEHLLFKLQAGKDRGKNQVNSLI